MIRMIILDNGHGEDTPGKRSPVYQNGRQIFEWDYARKIVGGIAKGLTMLGIPYAILVPESNDVPLRTRVQRANRIAAQNGISQTLLVSVHLNAGPGPNVGSGWEVHTSPGETKSDDYAGIFWEEAEKALRFRFPMRGDFEDGNPDRDSSFAIIRDTACPAVLTENLFMDNVNDCRFLMSDEGLQTIIDIHLNAISRIVAIL